jgi:ABC-2 type transport system ATP-binding protein
MTKNIIEIKNLVKKFDDFAAVNGISFSIKEGEIFGILGPNGAGKTTTINLILGLLKPTDGKIIVDGMDNQEHRDEIKNLIGMMTQETVVESELTARENLEFFASLYHVPEGIKENKVKQALADADLTEFANKKAGMFSGGMKRRLELVKSMLHEPKIIILDEPTTGLDVQNRSNMWVRIKELSKRGVTIIMTTQYLEEADVLCDRIAIIDHGKIKAIGTASELKALVATGDVLEIIADKANIDKIVPMIRKMGFDPVVTGDRISVVLGKSPIKHLNRITGEIHKHDLNALSISMHLPTLDDVFLKLTGSQLRDTMSEDTTSAVTKTRMIGRR